MVSTRKRAIRTVGKSNRGLAVSIRKRTLCSAGKSARGVAVSSSVGGISQKARR